MSGLHLACAADARYAPHSAAMISSVLEHSGDLDLHVHFLCGPMFPERSARRLAGMVESRGGVIEFIRIADERIAGLPPWDYVTVPMWYRIFLPELLPDLDRVLYLDDDVIALDSLAPLWATDFSGAYLAAVTNVFMHNDRDRPAALGLPGRDSYFNSGVLLLDLERMRRDGCTDAVLEYARAHPAKLGYPDQDALNIVLGAGRVKLHPRWNCMNGVMLFPWSEEVFGARAVAEARERPAIRHFEGPGANKPWHLLCERPGREHYFEHRRRTPWPRVRREGLTPANLVRRLGRAARRQSPARREPPPLGSRPPR